MSAIAAGKGFDGCDMKVGTHRPSVCIIGESDEEPPSAERNRVGVHDVVGISVGKFDTKGLERVALEQFSNLVRIHVLILAVSHLAKQDRFNAL